MAPNWLQSPQNWSGSRKYDTLNPERFRGLNERETLYTYTAIGPFPVLDISTFCWSSSDNNFKILRAAWKGRKEMLTTLVRLF